MDVEIVLFDLFILFSVRHTNIILVGHLEQFQVWMYRLIHIFVDLDLNIGAVRLAVPEETEWLEHGP